jgi:bifunctional DNase/RNase
MILRPRFYTDWGTARLLKVGAGCLSVVVAHMVHDSAIEMFVGGLVLDPATQAPIVVLKDEAGDTTLPIWIGIQEATSIASAIKHEQMSRPLTHDLFYDLLHEVGVTVQRVVITELKESTYFAELVLGQGDRVIVLDSRPSDAIAMALRASAPIYVAQTVLEQAKIAFAGSNPLSSPGSQSSDAKSQESQAGQGEPAEEADAETEEESKDFTGIDKDKWEELLSNLDPEDFKYKM